MLRNTEDCYGLIAVFLHWVMAIVVVSLFILGLWMVDLTYYDPWYRRAPEIHKAVGVLLFLTLLLRLIWRRFSPPPLPEKTLTDIERRAAAITHGLLYVLLFSVMVSGYLISTADGRPIDVFGLFQVPASVTGLTNQADIAGDVHWILAVSAISLASIHALAALKHHFIDRDRTLLRMFGIKNAQPMTNQKRMTP